MRSEADAGEGLYAGFTSPSGSPGERTNATARTTATTKVP